MIEIDMIPLEYRTRLWQTRWLRLAGVVVVSLILLNVLLFAGLKYEIRRVNEQIAQLQAQQLITTQQRSDLEVLNAQKAEFEQQLAILNGLRSGGAAEQMFVTIERALTTEDVWFIDWEFQRSGVVVNEGEKTVNTGYFIVVPANSENKETRPWQVQTHMTIRGQSRDHSALSSFVKGLFAQPEIEDVHVGRTSLRRYAAMNIVDFDLAIVLNTDVRPE